MCWGVGGGQGRCGEKGVGVCGEVREMWGSVLGCGGGEKSCEEMCWGAGGGVGCLKMWEKVWGRELGVGRGVGKCVVV